MPTVIMAKVQGINVSLVITSVAVVLFGVALAFGATDSTGKDVLAATAAYTAVLVVFCGDKLGWCQYLLGRLGGPRKRHERS